MGLRFLLLLGPSDDEEEDDGVAKEELLLKVLLSARSAGMRLGEGDGVNGLRFFAAETKGLLRRMCLFLLFQQAFCLSSKTTITKGPACADGHRLHRAANHFFYLQLQTLPVLVEIPPAQNLGIKPAVLLHQPAIHLGQNIKMFGHDDPALCGHWQLWPLLHVGLASARRLLSKPPKLEATKRHPVGHLKLQHP
jgi:hypothetical protein